MVLVISEMVKFKPWLGFNGEVAVRLLVWQGRYLAFSPPKGARELSHRGHHVQEF